MSDVKGWDVLKTNVDDGSYTLAPPEVQDFRDAMREEDDGKDGQNFVMACCVVVSIFGGVLAIAWAFARALT